MNTWPDQGIHHGVPFDVYRACDLTPADDSITCHGKSVSKSLIVDFLKDAAAWKARPKKEQTKAMLAGSLFDCLLTDGAAFADRYAVSHFEDFKTKAAREWRDDTEASGLAVITQDQLDVAQRQMEAVFSKPEAAELMAGAAFQVAFRHKTKFPFWSKGLIDVLPNDGETIVDIKTCDPRSLESHYDLRKHIEKFSYHIQAGCYCDGFGFASGEERHKFKFIFVGSAAPYTVAVVELPLAAIMLGADLYRAGVNKLGECLESDTWPSIWDGTVELDLPDYIYA